MTDKEIEIRYNIENFKPGCDVYICLSKEDIEKIRTEEENKKKTELKK